MDCTSSNVKYLNISVHITTLRPSLDAGEETSGHLKAPPVV